MCVAASSFFVEIEDLVLASFVDVEQTTVELVWNFSRYFPSNSGWFRQGWQDLLCRNARSTRTASEQRLIWRKKIPRSLRGMLGHRSLSFCQARANGPGKELHLLSLFSRHEVPRLVRLKSLFRLRGRGMGYLDHEAGVLRS